MENRCIFCGTIVPEGRQVCKNCEVKIMNKEGMRGSRILKPRLNIQKNFCKTFQCIIIHQTKYKGMQTDGLQNRSSSFLIRSLYQQSDRHFN